MKFLYIILFFLVSCNSKDDSPKLEKQIAISPEEVSYLLLDLERDVIIDSHNTNKKLIPASLFKIVTAYAALEILGSEYQFKTNIFYSGELKDGILEGDLIIQGLGDPSLAYQDLYNIAKLIKFKGIEKVRGRLLYDDSYFIKQAQISADQPASVYNPGLSALILKESNFAVEFDKNQQLFTVPKLDYLNFRINNRYNIPKYNNRGKWLLSKKRHFLPARDTSRFFTEILAQNLAKQGIKINNIAQSEQQENIEKLFSYEGADFLDVIRDNLQYSENIVSEVLLLHIVKKLDCDYANLADAANCLKKWYGKQFPKLDWDHLTWSNGSGLSTSTNITVNHLSAILKSLSDKKYDNNFGTSLFAVSGVEGTLLKKFRQYPLNIWGKTGTMYYISATAGFLYGEDKEYIFILMVNDKDSRKKMDGLQLDISNYLKYKQEIGKALKWRDLATEYQEKLINKWLQR